MAVEDPVSRRQYQILKEALEEIANYRHGCGCWPCTGSCEQIIWEAFQDIAKDALEEASR